MLSCSESNLPTKLSVGSKYEGSPVDYYNKRWEYNYKWKPPEENTIDFRIKIEKENKDKKIINKEYKINKTTEIIK